MWMCVWKLLFAFFFVPFSFSIVYRVWSHIVDVCQTDNTLQIGSLRRIVKMFWYFIACIIIIVIIIVKRFTNNNNTHLLHIYAMCFHSFSLCVFFSYVLLQIGSFFMINLCLVVIATQFAETKKREMERMRQERARYTSTSTIASSTNNSEPSTCYAEIVKYIAHLWRRLKRRLIKKLRAYKYE